MVQSSLLVQHIEAPGLFPPRLAYTGYTRLALWIQCAAVELEPELELHTTSFCAVYSVEAETNLCITGCSTENYRYIRTLSLMYRMVILP